MEELPLASVVHYAAAAATDRGRKRTSNEDAFGFSAEDGVYVVCDGMGGAAAGEIASAIAVDEMMRLLRGRIEEWGATMPRAAEEAVCAANEAIISRSKSDEKLNGMGTTLVSLVRRNVASGCSTSATAAVTGCAIASWSKSLRTTRWSRSKSGRAA